MALSPTPATVTVDVLHCHATSIQQLCMDTIGILVRYLESTYFSMLLIFKILLY